MREMRGAPSNFLSGWTAVAAGLLAVVAITAITSSVDNALGAALLFVGLLAGSFASIVIHELGHAIAAWLVGWRVWIVSALPVVVRLGHPVHFSTKLSHDVGGYVLGSPPTAALDRPWRSIVFTAGGPLASLLTGPLFIYWLTTLPRDGWEETPTAAGVLGAALALGFYGAWSAAVTLWPMRTREGRPNDMRMILNALVERKSPDHVRGAAWAGALFEFGVEPSAWPAWMRDSVARAGPSPWAAPVSPLLAFAAALEDGGQPEARAAAQRGAGEAGAILRAYVAAWFDRDVDGAERLLATAKGEQGAEALDWVRQLTQARILELKGDAQGATALRDQLARAVGDSGAPQPFWQRLLEGM